MQSTVSIIGEPQLVSSYQFEIGVSLKEYIQHDGRLRQKADDERIYIRKACGGMVAPLRRSWLSFGTTNEIEPDDRYHCGTNEYPAHEQHRFVDHRDADHVISGLCARRAQRVVTARTRGEPGIT